MEQWQMDTEEGSPATFAVTAPQKHRALRTAG